MKLSAMVADSLFIPPEWDREFNDIHSDSRDIKAGDLFIARAGGSAHGNDYISQAIESGAVAVLSECADMFSCVDGSVPVFPAKAINDHLPQWLATRYPGFRNLTLYGVTGTNGKSSVTQFIAQLSALCGHRCGVIGTLGNGIWPALENTRNTTPDICVVYRMLDKFAEAGADAAALEVSSHGLHQGRVEGIVFDVSILTNVTQDHLDYHGDMENYFAAKTALFDKHRSKSAVINVDDEYGQRLLRMPSLSERYLTISGTDTSEVNHSADVVFRHVRPTRNGMTAELLSPWGTTRVTIPLLGAFNVANIAAALTALAVCGEEFSNLTVKTEMLRPVAGRMALYVKPGSCKAVIDFAHTPDAIDAALSSLKPLSETTSLVFGCGGDRDRSKRPMMAAVAAQADSVWVTDDNPRTESPEQIFSDIRSAHASSGFTFIHDRSEAIEKAVKKTHEKGVVLIAGKGHENYQDVNNVKQPYSDEQVLLSLGYRPAGGDYVA